MYSSGGIGFAVECGLSLKTSFIKSVNVCARAGGEGCMDIIELSW